MASIIIGRDPLATRPADYPTLDRLGNNSSDFPLPGGQALGGYPTNATLPASEYNAQQNATGSFVQELDEGLVSYADISSPTDSARLTLDAPRFPTSAGLTSLDITEGTAFLVPGPSRPYVFRVSGLARLTRLGLTNVTFTPSVTTWFYAGIDGGDLVIRKEEIGAAAPPAGFIALLGVVTDGTDVTGFDYTGTPDHKIPLTATEITVDTITVPNAFEASTLGPKARAKTLLVAEQGLDVQAVAANLNAGAVVPGGQSISGAGVLSLAAVTATGTVAGARVALTAGASPTADGQIYRDASGFLRYRISGVEFYVEFGQCPRVIGRGQLDDSGAFAATTFVPTDFAVSPPAACDFIVIGDLMVSRNGGAGSVIIELQVDDGGGIFSTIGASETYNIAGGGAGDFSAVTISRTYNADTTDRTYRIRVTGGATYQVKSGAISAEPKT